MVDVIMFIGLFSSRYDLGVTYTTSAYLSLAVYIGGAGGKREALCCYYVRDAVVWLELSPLDELIDPNDHCL